MAVSWSCLSVSAYAVVEAGQLFDSDRSSRMQPPGGNADFRTEAELAAVRELRRSIMQHDRGVHFAQEFFCRFAVFGHDRIGVMRTIAFNVGNGGVDAVDHAGGQNGVKIFSAPIFFARGL